MQTSIVRPQAALARVSNVRGTNATRAFVGTPLVQRSLVR